MSAPARREHAVLAAISSSQGMTLLIPLYLAHLGQPVGLVGLLAGLGELATLLSRFPVPLLYRPERSRALLLISLGGGALSAAVLPLLPHLAVFTAVVVGNRALGGVMTTGFLSPFF